MPDLFDELHRKKKNKLLKKALDKQKEDNNNELFLEKIERHQRNEKFLRLLIGVCILLCIGLFLHQCVQNTFETCDECKDRCYADITDGSTTFGVAEDYDICLKNCLFHKCSD